MGKNNLRLEWLLLALLIFIPRLLDLNLFLTADEPLFLDHAREFAGGMAAGDFKQTLGIGYPGVTVAVWTAPVIGLPQTELGAYTIGRAAVAWLTGLLMLAIYALSRRLWGHWPALIGVSLLALDPYTLAYSRLFHIEAPLALLMTLAGLSTLLGLYERQARWFIGAGLFTGLALLTKSTALLLGPMLGLMIVGWGWAAGQWHDRNWRRSSLKGGLLLILIGGTTFWVLWPAMWVDPFGALALTFGKLFADQEAGAGNLGLFWFGRYVEDPGPLFYPVAFILKSTPWLIAGLLLSLTYCVFRIAYTAGRDENGPRATHHAPVRSLPMERTTSQTTSILSSNLSFTHYVLPTFSLWLFSLTYLIFMTLASKKSIRYMLPAFPVFYLLAGLAFYQSREWLNKWRLKFLPRPPAPMLVPEWVLLGLSLTILILFTFFYHPYYFTYYNPLFLGWRWAPHAVLVGWGEGLDEAARYLNRQPAQRVAAWYEWIFPLFYSQGEVQAVTPQENLITADRTVLYINQVQRDIPGPNIIHYFRSRRQPEHTVRLAGIDYAWVYPGPIAGFQMTATPDYAIGGEFGGEAHLLGYTLHPQPIAGGAPLLVTLFWEVLNTPTSNRFVYLRLIDARGHIWARADGPPVMGLWPAARWQPGMFIEDAHELSIPAGTPPGIYRLEVGMYDPDSGQPLAATDQPVGQGGGLLLGEVAVEWRSWSQTELDLPHQVDIPVSADIHLIGYNMPSAAATVGDLIPIDLVWREAGPLWRFGQAAEQAVSFEWSKEGQLQAEQIDPLPLPVAQWGRGAVLHSQHNLITPPVLTTGSYDLRIRLHNGSEPPGAPFLLGTVTVTAPDHQFDLPAAAIAPVDGMARFDQKIRLAGYELEQVDQTLYLDLYWQTQTTLTTRYKIFAQLLNADQRLLAQSDAIPAAGQRPTTGWLPQEIIRDPHRLALPADLPQAGQRYRLIAGLYDPVNGQRVPVLNEQGEIVSDSILVAEVTLP